MIKSQVVALDGSRAMASAVLGTGSPALPCPAPHGRRRPPHAQGPRAGGGSPGHRHRTRGARVLSPRAALRAAERSGPRSSGSGRVTLELSSSGARPGADCRAGCWQGPKGAPRQAGGCARHSRSRPGPWRVVRPRRPSPTARPPRPGAPGSRPSLPRPVARGCCGRPGKRGGGRGGQEERLRPAQRQGE